MKLKEHTMIKTTKKVRGELKLIAALKGISMEDALAEIMETYLKALRDQRL